MNSISTEPRPVVLDFGPILQKMSNQEFFEFCQRNRDWRIERTSEGNLIILPPTGGTIGHINFNLVGIFGDWVRSDGTGIGFGSSTGFTLP